MHSKSIEFKTSYSKAAMYIRRKRGFRILSIIAAILLFFGDVILTVGVLSGTGWGCYRDEQKKKPTISCKMDVGFRWKSNEFKNLAILLGEKAFMIGISFSSIGCLIKILTLFSMFLSEINEIIVIRMIGNFIGFYSIQTAILLYTFGYRQMARTFEVTKPPNQVFFTNLIESFGFSYYLTIFGWMIFSAGVFVDSMGVIIPKAFQSRVDDFFSRWLDKYYRYLHKKYVILNDCDIGNLHVDHLQ